MPALLLLDIHESWAWVVVVANGLAGLWALAAHQWPIVRVRPLWWFTIAAELTMLVQVIFGVILINRYEIEAPEFHMFYGFVALIAIAILYSYRSQLKHRIHLLYGFGSLFVMGLGIRAMLLG
jgi:hypothetical protein